MMVSAKVSAARRDTVTFQTFTTVPSTFDLVRKVDKNGRKIELKKEYAKSSAVR